jgi:16S rRNA pseudouridine516 synthase
MSEKKIRLDRLLSNLGYGSRKDVAYLIKAGLVTSDLGTHTSASENIAPASINIHVDGEPLDPLPPLTLLIHKPVGYTCSHDEVGNIIFDLLPDRFRARSPQLSPAGRLDKDSSGAVLLTDDGDLLHRIISPKHHVTKKYNVTLADPLNGNETALFMSGHFTLKDDTKPLKPALWQPADDKSGVMFLTEGRYHQIRRMFGAVGNKVLTLHRERIGQLDLGDIAEGTFQILSSHDIEKIFAKG